MDKSETLRIMAVLKAAYPNFYKDFDKENTVVAVNLWHEMFSEESYELVQCAVKAFITGDAKGFPPSIGAIKEYIFRITEPPKTTELEAWDIIRKALRNCAYDYKAEWEKLPDDLKSMTSPGQMHEWALMDTETVNSVVASNFMRSYKARIKSNKEYAALPSNVKSFISSLSGAMSMKRIESQSGCEVQ